MSYREVKVKLQTQSLPRMSLALKAALTAKSKRIKGSKEPYLLGPNTTCEFLGNPLYQAKTTATTATAAAAPTTTTTLKQLNGEK